MAIAVTVFAAQMAISAWWLERYRFGPLEWLWRSLTYGRAQPMLRPTANSRLARASLIVFSLTFSAVSAESLAGQQLPRIEPAEACPMQVGDELRDDVSCGWLLVPQDRRAGTGTPMRLAYAVARATSNDRLPDPIVVHFGGPSATLYQMDQVLRSPPWSELLQRRDIIFLDQRGTGYSEPRPCRSLHEFFHDAALLLPAERETNAQAARLAAECRESAKAEGVELSAFGGSEVAEDYENLLTALGYEQWNWYGASYGGQIGQILLRQYPDRLRSVVLASPAVLGATDHGTKPFGEALDQLFSSCRADSRCSRAYPQLERDFDLLMARLEATPATLRAPAYLGFPGDRFVVNRNVALFAIQKSLSGDALPAVLPALVTAAARGSEDPLYGLMGSIVGAWNENLDMTVSLVVRCLDMEASERATMAERAQYPRAAYGGWMTPRVYALCDSLGVEPVATQDGPVGSADTPVLVLGGGRDAWVAPSDIRALADRLDNATLVYAPDKGHGIPNLECSERIIAAFIVNPRGAVDAACMTNGQSAGFLTDLAEVEGMGGFQAWVTGYLSGYSSRRLNLWMGLPLLVFLSALVAWPFVLLRRRYRAPAIKGSSGERAALAVGFATAMVAMLFWGGLFVATQTTARVNRHALAVGVLGDFGWVFALPWALMGLTSLLVIALLVAWRHRYWSVPMRVHFSMVVFAAVVFTAFIAYWPLF